MRIKRGDIFYADLRPAIGCEQNGVRPVLIIQNNLGNKHSPTVITAAITSKSKKTNFPTHVDLTSSDVLEDSVILLEQVRTIDKSRLKEFVGHISPDEESKVNEALQISFAL